MRKRDCLLSKRPGACRAGRQPCELRYENLQFGGLFCRRDNELRLGAQRAEAQDSAVAPWWFAVSVT